jgi:V8-like Glu-specific endopeptidase
LPVTRPSINRVAAATCIALAVALSLVEARSAQDQHARDERGLYHSGRPIDVPRADGTTGPISVAAGETKEVCADEDVVQFRLKLRPVGSPGAITVKSTNGEDHPLDVSQLIENPWTGRLHERCARVTVSSGDGSVVIERLLVPSHAAAPKSAFPENSTPDYKDPLKEQPPGIKNRIQDAARLTALLAFMRGDEEFSCTAWFISKRLLVTNHHCVDSEARARTLAVDVGYFEGALPSESFMGASFLFGSNGLDYAVIELKSDSALSVSPIAWRKGGARAVESIAIIQHPGGVPVKGAWDGECVVRSLRTAGRDGSQVDFGHRCDTEGGSSGGMVLGRSPGCAQIIGLHHWGVETYSPDAENQAVRIEDVYADIEQRTSKEGREGEDAKRVLAVIAPLGSCPG